MKVLLDECIDRRLAKYLTTLTVLTVPQMGWSGLKNGKLLKVAEENFDAFITVDKNLSIQQPVSNFNIAVLVIKTKSNRLNDLILFSDQIMSSILVAKPGTVTILETS